MLCSFFLPERIFSASNDDSKSGKRKTMERAMNLGLTICSPDLPRFVSCGDGKSEAKAAETLKIRHVHCSGSGSLAGVC